MAALPFLRQARGTILELVRQPNITSAATVNLIFGNESCDLDSAMSALVYAWFLTQVQSASQVTHHIPILNIPENMFRLKTETVHLLRKHGVYQNNLIFRDTVDLQKLFCSDKHDVKITLVDHHVLPRSDEYLYPLVTEVIDHRLQVKTFEPQVKVEIATVGSCVTLIAERIISAVDDGRIKMDSVELEEIVSLITGPILLDTVNLEESAGKVTKRDMNVIRRFWEDHKHPELAMFFLELSEAKYSADELSAEDLMLKDAKFIESTNGETRVMFSTIHVKLRNFLQNEDATSCIPALLCLRNCDIWVGLAPVEQDESAKAYKPIILYSQNDELSTKVNQAMWTSKNPSLQLTTMKNKGLGQEFTQFRMYNIKASRKQVLPVVQKVID